MFWDELREDSMFRPHQRLLGPENYMASPLTSSSDAGHVGHCTIGRPVISENALSAAQDPRGISRAYMQKHSMDFNKFR